MYFYLQLRSSCRPNFRNCKFIFIFYLDHNVQPEASVGPRLLLPVRGRQDGTGQRAVRLRPQSGTLKRQNNEVQFQVCRIERTEQLNKCQSVRIQTT